MVGKIENISQNPKQKILENQRKTTKWDIPWLKTCSTQKNTRTKKENFVEKEERTVRKPIVSAREIITKETIVTEKSYKNPNN